MPDERLAQSGDVADRHRRRACAVAFPANLPPTQSLGYQTQGVSIVDDPDWADYGHEQILQAVVRHALTADDLDQLCEAAETPTLVDAAGSPVTITSARTYRDAGVLTLDPGVLLELSDGSQFGLTITVSRRPSDEVNLRPPHAKHRPAPPYRRTPSRRAAEHCGRACATGGFCGGCGHAGCARR